MLTLFYALLMLKYGCCTDDYEFVTRTGIIGENVTLTCPRHKSPLLTGNLFWIRIVSGNWPEFLGRAFYFDTGVVIKTPHYTLKQSAQAFILHINEATLSDTGLYFCIQVIELDIKFVKGEFLKIKGPEPEPDITTVIQEPPSDPVHPDAPVTLNCSILSNIPKKTCPSNHSVYWFRAGSHGSYPSLIHVDGTTAERCERSPEARSAQKCDYSFSKTVRSTDAGTYYCAVASCGHILFGNGVKLEIKASDMWDLQTANLILCLLCAALTTSLVVITFLVYTIKKKSCSCFNDPVTTCGDRQIQERNEDSLVYSETAFSKRKAGRAERRHVQRPQEIIYSDVRV